MSPKKLRFAGIKEVLCVCVVLIMSTGTALFEDSFSCKCMSMHCCGLVPSYCSHGMSAKSIKPVLVDSPKFVLVDTLCCH